MMGKDNTITARERKLHNMPDTSKDELGDVLRTLSIKLTAPMSVTGKVPDNLYDIESEAHQAIEKLYISRARVAEAIGEDEVALDPYGMTFEDGKIEYAKTIRNQLRQQLRKHLLEGEQDNA